MRKIFFIFPILIVALLSFSWASAQNINFPQPPTINVTGINIEASATPATTVATSSNNASETEISAQDLGVKPPKILPGNPWFGLKRAWRSIKLAFTFNRIKRAKMRAKYLNEDLIGLKKALPRIENEKAKEKILNFYQKEQESLDKIVDEIKAKTGDSPKTEKLLEWMAQNRLKHIAVLGNLVQKLPPKAAEKVEAVKEREIEKIADRINQLEQSGKADKFLEKVSQFEGEKKEIRNKLMRSPKMKRIIQRVRARREFLKNLPPKQRQEIRNHLKESSDKQIQNRNRDIQHRNRFRKPNNAPVPLPHLNRTQKRIFLKRLRHQHQQRQNIFPKPEVQKPTNILEVPSSRNSQ